CRNGTRRVRNNRPDVLRSAILSNLEHHESTAVPPRWMEEIDRHTKLAALNNTFPCQRDKLPVLRKITRAVFRGYTAHRGDHCHHQLEYHHALHYRHISPCVKYEQRAGRPR